MKKIAIYLFILFLFGCAGAHYQALPGASKMEKGQQRIAVNFSASLGQKKEKLKWYIPKNWWISNWGYCFEYRYGLGNNMDIGVYPAGLNIFPCAIDLRWLDKERFNSIYFHRMEIFYNSITYLPQVSNLGIRYDYFSKRFETDEYNMFRVQGASLILSEFLYSNGKNEKWFHLIPGAFVGEESENVLYEFDYMPGFNYFMQKPDVRNPIVNFSDEKKNIPYYLSGDLFFGISHGNSYTE